MTGKRVSSLSSLLLLSLLFVGCGSDGFFQKTSVGDRIEGLKSSRPAHVRRENVRWLMEHPRKIAKDDKKEIVELLSLLVIGDQDRLVRGYAAVAIGRLKDPGGIKALLEAMQRDKDPLVRCDAAKALAKYQDPAMIPEFARVVRVDRVSDVRQTAVIAIADLGGKDAVPPLIDALRDRDASVAFTASERLTQLTGQPLGLSQEAWRNWWRKNANQPLGGTKRRAKAKPKKEAAPKAEPPKKKDKKSKKKKKKLFFF
ncbi:MAG: HEAT repeat domain-containing protein [Planctomycetes bacterium]|nr:HEAT repeat domain-containing protein [Planctomycetota bacterium]